MSGYTSEISSDRVITGERLIKLTPKIKPPSALNGVAWAHGAGTNSILTILDNDYNTGSLGDLTARITGDNLYTAVAGDNGFDTWGNDAGTSKLDSNINYLRGLSGVNPIGKVALVFGSMGGIVALNYALAHPDKVSCIVGIIPVINVQDIAANNRGNYAGEINTAYGTYNEATMGATHNPYTYRNSATIANIPMLFYYGATDTLCLPTYTQAFISAAPTKRTGVQLASGHDLDSYKNADHQAMMNFIIANNIG